MRRRVPAPISAGGFSLLEMLVVLAIAGVIIAVTAPPLSNYLAAASFASEANDLGRRVAELRASALLQQRRIEFPAIDETGRADYGALASPPPDGWRIEGGPIIFLPSGACSGGLLTVIEPGGRAASFRFEAPRCRYERVS